jgi:hypothetical protein
MNRSFNAELKSLQNRNIKIAIKFVFQIRLSNLSIYFRLGVYLTLFHLILGFLNIWYPKEQLTICFAIENSWKA